MPDVYDEILKYEQSGVVTVRRYATFSEKEKSELFEMMVHFIFKNDFVNSTNKKAAFFRKHFPEAWEYVKSYPERRQNVLDAWAEKIAKLKK